MKNTLAYAGLLALCAAVVLVMVLLTAGLRSLGADPTLAGLIFVPVLVVGYFLTRARP